MDKQLDGTYKISCKINGAPMKMLFDTGASVVSISKSTAMYLYSNELIDENDFIGIAKVKIANGDITDNMIIRLKDVEIGGLHLKNVEAVVTSSLNAPLLLGQSVISKLGKITLNGNILIIHSSNSQSLSKEERDKIDNRLRMLRANRITDKEANFEILDIVKKIEESGELNEYELFCKLVSESNINNNDEALVDAKKWLERYSLETDSVDLKMRTIYVSARANILSEKGDKELGMKHLKRCSSYFEKDSLARFYWLELPNLYFEYEKYKGDGYPTTIYIAKSTINHLLKAEGLSVKDINNNMCLDHDIKLHFAFMSFIYYQHFNWINEKNNSPWDSNQDKTIKLWYILAAKLGYPQAIDFCKQSNMDYKRKLTRKELEFIGFD